MDLIRQEIGLLKDENQNQKTEMALLKETMESKDRKVHRQIDQLGKELRQRMNDFTRESPTDPPSKVITISICPRQERLEKVEVNDLQDFSLYNCYIIAKAMAPT